MNFWLAELSHFERRAHLRYVPLAGGDRAIREPWRMAVSYLSDALDKDPNSLELPGWDAIPGKKIALITAMMQGGVNTVPTSSCGRLFDAVASIIGLRHEANYEGQAAIELEMAALDRTSDSYPFMIGEDSPWQIDMRAAIECLVRDIQMKLPVSLLATKFHNTIVSMIVEVCRRLRDSDGLKRVCLSGGSFQNIYILERVVPALRDFGFEVYFNRRVPLNDGGIALGQAAIANATLQRGD